MELVLNILWALVACGTFVVLLPKSRGGRVAVIGLLCVAALLFPIISVSDDLNATRDAWEESASIRRVSSIIDAFGSLGAASLPVAVSHAAVALCAVGHVEVEIVPALIRLLPADSDPRSPPNRTH